MNGRPLSVTLLGSVYIAVGTIGFAYHFAEFQARDAFGSEEVLVAFIRLLAIISGTFILRGHNWARWLALAWIVFHVILSAFHSFREFAIHCLFCAAIAWFLFRPQATPYFIPTARSPTR